MNFDFMFLEELCVASTPVLMKSLQKQLLACYKKVIYTPECVVAFGEIPIALVAHVDTVVPFAPSELFYDRFKRTCLALGQGAGFDDRAGIYAIWKIVEACGKCRPTIILTTGEEDYGVGAHKLASKVDIGNIKYLIELDRAGVQDCVFYYCENEDFKKYVESFGFKEEKGSYTDISFLMHKWKICGVNLSVGYFCEHTDWENLNVDALHLTINKVLRMLREENIPDFEYKGDGSKWL